MTLVGFIFQINSSILFELLSKLNARSLLCISKVKLVVCTCKKVHKTATPLLS